MCVCVCVRERERERVSGRASPSCPRRGAPNPQTSNQVEETFIARCAQTPPGGQASLFLARLATLGEREAGQDLQEVAIHLFKSGRRLQVSTPLF